MKRRCSRSEVVRDGGDAVEFSVERQPVIVTRVANADTIKYTVVPTTTEGFTEGVVINAWAPWLGKALSVKEEPDRDILAHFVQDVIRALLAQALMTDMQRCHGSSGVPDDSPPKGRAALGFGDDSASEDDSQASQSFLAKTSAKLEQKARKDCTSDFRTVLVDGVEISAKLKHKGKGILVPNDDHLANVLTVLRARLTEGSNSDVEARASKRRALMMERKSANTVPRHVRYNTVSSGGRYTIFFTTFDGKKRQMRFRVPRYDLEGKVLSDEDFAANREMARKRAIAAWNAKDESGAPRLGDASCQ